MTDHKKTHTEHHPENTNLCITAGVCTARYNQMDSGKMKKKNRKYQSRHVVIVSLTGVIFRFINRGDVDCIVPILAFEMLVFKVQV